MGVVAGVAGWGGCGLVGGLRGEKVVCGGGGTREEGTQDGSRIIQ